jgi:glutaredoxin
VKAKVCPDCGILKLASDFPVERRRKDGLGPYCRDCNKVRCRAYYEKKQAAQGKKPRRQVPQPSDPGLRRCPDCREVKRLLEFPKSGEAWGTYCKPCHNARGKRSVEGRGGSRNYHLKRRYGISAAEVDAMVEAQAGLCLVCRERPAEHVDHDHLSGAVRGVLCFSCNGGLGLFRDRVDIMSKAIDYLERTTWQKTLESPGVYRLLSPRPAAAASSTSSTLLRRTSSRRG